MTEKSQKYWTITCRICLKISNFDMKYIFAEPCLSDDIVTKIIKCGGIPVDIADGMPDKICNVCLLDLDTAYRFRSACQKSYHHFHQLMIDQEKEISPADKYLEELKQEEDPDDHETDNINLSASPEQNPLRDSIESFYLSGDELLDEELIQEMKEVEAEVETKLECQNQNKSKDSPKTAVPEIDKSTKYETKKLRKGRPIDPISNYICYCCGNLYKSQSKLSQHIKLHSAEKPHECEICQKKFAQAAQLSRHMNSHTGNRPYKCKYCPSSFADPSTCIKHERIHTNIRPFKCLECGKTFTYSNVLKVHQKTHTGEKPFSCSVCDKKFTQLHHKKSHERIHSSNNCSEKRSAKKEKYSIEF